MRFGAEAVVAGLLCLAGSAAGCGPGSRQTARGDSPPPPSPALTRAITDGERAALAALPAGPGQAEVEGSCLICHGAAMIEQQHKDSAGWAKTVNQMRTWGAPLAPEQVPAVIAYLTQQYGVTGR
jgi:hypothetical protein